MTPQDPDVARVDQREYIAALLSRYPDLSEPELQEVHRWFRHSATALDLGMLASDPAVASQYRAYRAEHRDRFTASDYIRAAIFILLMIAAVGSIAIVMP